MTTLTREEASVNGLMKAPLGKPKSYREFLDRWLSCERSLTETQDISWTDSSTAESDDLSEISCVEDHIESRESSRIRKEIAFWQKRTCLRKDSDCFVNGPVSNLGKAEAFFNTGMLRVQLQEDVEAACLELSMAIRLYKDILPKPQASVSKCQHWLAKALVLSKDFKRAEKVAKEAFQLRKRVFGSESVTTVETSFLLASILFVNGQVANSILLYKQVLQRREAMFAHGHPSLAITASSLARAYLKSGKMEEGDRYLKYALDICEMSGQDQLAKQLEKEVRKCGERVDI